MNFDDRAYPSDHTSTPASDVGEAAQKVLRNTYLLLGLSMLPTVLGAGIGMLTGFNLFTFGGPVGLLLYLGIAFALIFAVRKTKDSSLGLVFLLAFTFFMGLMLTGILSVALSFSNGGTLIALAAGGTGVIFFALSGIAATTKRDFSNIGKFLFIGLMVVIVLFIANLFLHLPALSLAISGAALLIFSGYILY
ncbi:MAG: Bax inhibitor-1 family protein, partial [Zoogloeaceae bacterium]|nr:Bax inhibitor-1 family protein [Zoogloeaceae bacterium]